MEEDFGVEMVKTMRRCQFNNNDSNGRPYSRGFTLVEMMIVFGLIGILLIVAVPNISLFLSGYKLRGATREVATDLQYARLLAVKENRSYRVAFLENSYQVVRVSDGTVVKSRNLAADYPDVSLTRGNITFSSRGTLDPSTSNADTISVSNPRGTKMVTIASTGRVKVE